MYGVNGSTTGYGMLDAVRIRDIEMWGFGSAGSVTPSSIGIKWENGSTSSVANPNLTIVDYGNANNLSHVKVKPVPLTSAAFWQASGADAVVAFYLNCAVGDLVRITLEYTLLEQQTDYILTGTGVSLGINYNFLGVGFKSTSGASVTTRAA